MHTNKIFQYFRDFQSECKQQEAFLVHDWLQLPLCNFHQKILDVLSTSFHRIAQTEENLNEYK